MATACVRKPLALALLMLIFAAVAPHQHANAQSISDAATASIDMLRRAVTPNPRGTHAALLFGLRQLRDPQLQPLLQHVAASDDWQSQVHGVLGLAEMSSEKRVDPALILTITPQAQEAAIAAALDLELLSADQMKQLLAHDNLHPMARLFMVAELVMLGEAVDREDLQRIAHSQDDHVAGLACGLLAQHTGDLTPLYEFQPRLEKLAPALRHSTTIWMFDAFRRYRITSAAPWIESIVQDSAINTQLAYRGVLALLQLDPARGLAMWKRWLGENPTYSQRVHWGLALLATDSDIPAAAYDRLVAPGVSSDDEPLIAPMVAVGKAISTGSDVTEPMIALLERGHAATTEWALRHTEQLPAEQASRIYQYLIERVTDPQPSQIDPVALASGAAAELGKINPSLALSLLAQAEDDSAQQQAILLGLLEVDVPACGEAAASLRRVGLGRTDSLALLLMAKHAPLLSAYDQEQLGRLALGGGLLPDVLQMQAAWLYLKHTGRASAALEAALGNSR